MSSTSSGASPRRSSVQEDFELSWRAHLHGLRVLILPEADVLHDYVLERPGRRRSTTSSGNRLIVVLSAFSGRLLLLLAPVLLAVERDRARRLAPGLAPREDPRLDLART